MGFAMAWPIPIAISSYSRRSALTAKRKGWVCRTDAEFAVGLTRTTASDSSGVHQLSRRFGPILTKDYLVIRTKSNGNTNRRAYLN